MNKRSALPGGIDARATAKQSELTEERWSSSQIENLNDLMFADPPEEILLWADENFSPKLKFACEFSLEDGVLLHMLRKLNIKPHIFFLDTGRHHEETFALIDTYQEHYQLEIQIFTPDTGNLSKLLALDGLNRIYRSSDARMNCCYVRREEPLTRALAGAEAWLSGTREEATVSPEFDGILEIDRKHGGILKIQPLFHWSWQQVWDYVHTHKLPYHQLYDKKYTSIACAPCHRPVEVGGVQSQGSWCWEKSQQNLDSSKDERTTSIGRVG